MRDIARYLRANPQVLALVLICLVLGLGTFIAVLVALAQSHTGTTTGEPSGAVWAVGFRLLALVP